MMSKHNEVASTLASNPFLAGRTEAAERYGHLAKNAAQWRNMPCPTVTAVFLLLRPRICAGDSPPTPLCTPNAPLLKACGTASVRWHILLHVIIPLMMLSETA
jgi:hypothetical protein